jgi:hypothetical protein
MDDSLYAVLLSMLMYILYVLVPLIPSVLIYKVFPKTKVTLSGPLSHLTLKASGAFAAYVIIIILCYSPVQHSEDLIAGLAYPTWTVTASVTLLDSANHVVPHPEIMLGGLKVITTPELAKTSGNEVVLSVPGITDPMRSIAIILPDWGQTTINLQQLNKDKIKVDNFHKHLDIGEIEIAQIRLPSKAYAGNQGPIQLLADSIGPPKIRK